MKQYLMGIDNGGSEIKCAVFGMDGEEIAVAGRRLPISVPAPGFTERDALQVWEANAEAIREAIEKAGISGKQIKAVGLTGYGNGLCLVDGKGEPTCSCIVSTDNRAADYCRRFAENGAERAIYPMTCQTIWSAQPAALLPWFKDNRPEVLEKSAWYLSIKDFIRFRLTGVFACEMTDASSGCLLNLHTREFDQKIFDALGIGELRRLMPPCLESTDVSGYVTAEAAKRTGLAEGTPVAGGYFDIDAGALASGVLGPDMLCLIAGTWSINEYLRAEANTDYDKNCNTVTLSFLPGYFLVEDSSPTSASNFDWYVRTFLEPGHPGIAPGELYRQCDRELERCFTTDNDIIFVPYLYGSNSNPDAKGAFFNLTSYHNSSHVLQAVYEGVAFSTMYHVKNLRRPVTDYRTARLSGGVAKSRVWAQMMADILQMPIEVLKSGQISAQGAAMGAGVACGAFASLEDAVEHMVQTGGVFEPRREYAEYYAGKYAAFERALKALDVFHTAQPEEDRTCSQ